MKYRAYRISMYMISITILSIVADENLMRGTTQKFLAVLKERKRNEFVDESPDSCRLYVGIQHRLSGILQESEINA
jgi:hypothetical protein